jgi:hypothetical protein
MLNLHGKLQRATFTLSLYKSYQVLLSTRLRVSCNHFDFACVNVLCSRWVCCGEPSQVSGRSGSPAVRAPFRGWADEFERICAVLQFQGFVVTERKAKGKERKECWGFLSVRVWYALWKWWRIFVSKGRDGKGREEKGRGRKQQCGW